MDLISVVAGYYGIQLNSVNLTSNFFLSFILLALAEIPGTLATKFHDNLGRKTTLFIGLLLLGVSCLFAGFVKSGTFVTVLSMVGKAASALCFGVNYQYSGEMFPTQMRSSAIGVCSMIARIGAIAAPQVSEFIFLLSTNCMVLETKQF